MAKARVGGAFAAEVGRWLHAAFSLHMLWAGVDRRGMTYGGDRLRLATISVVTDVSRLLVDLAHSCWYV